MSVPSLRQSSGLRLAGIVSTSLWLYIFFFFFKEAIDPAELAVLDEFASGECVCYVKDMQVEEAHDKVGRSQCLEGWTSTR